MNLYGLSAVVLLIGVVLTVMVFRSYRQRLAGIGASSEALSIDQLKTTFKSTPVERALGYGLVAAIGYLILQTIQQGFDFALLMMGATVFTGIIWFVDRQLTKKTRLEIIARAEQQIENFDDQTDKSTLEPGLIENSRAFFPILVFVFLLRSFLVEPFQIPSGSMKPTLEVSDFILVNRFAYGIRMPITNQIIVPVSQPERGDVIVFKPPHEPSKNYIKRVIAVPGDHVYYDYVNRQLFVNGELAVAEFTNMAEDDAGLYLQYDETLGDKTYTIYKSRGNGRNIGWIEREGIVLPEGKYFTVGDNRDSSFDARYWESLRQQQFANNGEDWRFVDENAILGKAFVIWMHWEGFYPSFSRAGSIQ
jgi:signal peptidase I